MLVQNHLIGEKHYEQQKHRHHRNHRHSSSLRLSRAPFVYIRSRNSHREHAVFYGSQWCEQLWDVAVHVWIPHALLRVDLYLDPGRGRLLYLAEEAGSGGYKRSELILISKQNSGGS